MAFAPTPETIKKLETIVGRKFEDGNILVEALLAPGCGIPVLGQRHIPDGNKRMAIVGNTVLKLIVIVDQYQSGSTRGVIDENIQRITKSGNLESRGFEIGLDRHIILNPSQQGKVSPRVMQDTVEAIVGAAYLDGGMDAAREVTAALGLDQNLNRTTADTKLLLKEESE